MIAMKPSRRAFILGAMGTGIAVSWASSQAANAQEAFVRSAEQSRFKRIKMATIGAPDIAQVAAWYTNWLDYQVVGQGVVPADLAASWGTPASAGRRTIVLGPASGEDVYVRAVEIDPVPAFKTLTTWGWGAIEITVSDVDTVLKKLEGGPFRVIGLPRMMMTASPIRVMQVVGPAEEVLYLTGNVGDRAASNHPEPKTLIDRIFIMVLAGPDLPALKKFYLETFSLGDQGDLSIPVGVLWKAQGLPADHIYDLSVLITSERGNKLELDQYDPPFGARPGPADQVPPGVAMATFEVDSLENLAVDFITPPDSYASPHYAGYVAATFIGPAGERTELVARKT